MRLLFALLLALLPALVQAQALDGASRNLLRMTHSDRPAHALRPDGSVAASGPSRSESRRLYRSAIIDLEAERADLTLAELEAKGAVILHRRDELVLACLPVDLFGDDTFEPHPNGFRSVALSRRARPFMDLARAMTHTDAAHEGIDGLPRDYDGSGIVAGIVDSGFDPAHPAFADRVGLFTVCNDTLATVTRGFGHREALAMITDTPDQTHATHVANIMAGGRTAQPYYGVAPEADLAFAGSLLYDVGILAGVEDIIDYAHSCGKRAVINMSLGAYNGPHDGTDLFCRYLDRCAEDAVIVLSAGNEGWGKCHIGHTFTSEKPSVTTSLQTTLGWDGNRMLGQTDIWGDPSADFELRLSIIDIDLGRYTPLSDWIRAGHPEADFMMDSEKDAALTPYYIGRLAVASDRSYITGRPNITFDYDLTSTTHAQGHGWARYYLVLEVRGREGSHIDMHTDAEYSYFNNLQRRDLLLGGNDLSISNIACGQNTISVGASVSRPTLDYPDGSHTDWGVEAGTVAPFSSWGILRDGRSTPDFCAPGCHIISAGSGPCRQAHPEVGEVIATEPDSKAYWFGQSGTSMASPHAAGIFALWLQADPDLTAEDLRRIASETARRDFSDIDNPRWGAGCIDALAGLKAILITGGVAQRPLDLTLTIRTERRRIIAESLTGADVDLLVADMSGRTVAHDSELAPGVYAVRASDGTSTLTQKVCIR